VLRSATLKCDLHKSFGGECFECTRGDPLVLVMTLQGRVEVEVEVEASSDTRTDLKG
jgi:hypothetical protein